MADTEDMAPARATANSSTRRAAANGAGSATRAPRPPHKSLILRRRLTHALPNGTVRDQVTHGRSRS